MLMRLLYWVAVALLRRGHTRNSSRRRACLLACSMSRTATVQTVLAISPSCVQPLCRYPLGTIRGRRDPQQPCNRIGLLPQCRKTVILGTDIRRCRQVWVEVLLRWVLAMERGHWCVRVCRLSLMARLLGYANSTSRF